MRNKLQASVSIVAELSPERLHVAPLHGGGASALPSQTGAAPGLLKYGDISLRKAFMVLRYSGVMKK